MDPPLSAPPRFSRALSHPGLHLLLAVSSLHRTAIDTLLAQNPKACDVLEAFRADGPARPADETGLEPPPPITRN